MNPRKCAICGKTHDLFKLEIPGEEPDWPATVKYVCGSCWEVIATIAKAAMKSALLAQQEEAHEAT